MHTHIHARAHAHASSNQPIMLLKLVSYAVIYTINIVVQCTQWLYGAAYSNDTITFLTWWWFIEWCGAWDNRHYCLRCCCCCYSFVNSTTQIKRPSDWYRIFAKMILSSRNMSCLFVYMGCVTDKDREMTLWATKARKKERWGKRRKEMR